MLIGTPKVTVIFYSTNEVFILSGVLGDPNSDILSVSTNKDMSSPAGSFSINLVARKDKDGKTWFDKIGLFDFVEIKFKGIKIGESEKIVMRGLVDSVSKSETYDAIPVRTITVSGRDLGCLLTDFQIYVIPEMGSEEAVRAKLGVLAWKAVKRYTTEWKKGESLLAKGGGSWGGGAGGGDYSSWATVTTTAPDLAGTPMNAKEVFNFLVENWLDEIDLTIGGVTLGESQKLSSLGNFINYDAESFYPGNKTNILFLISYLGSWWGAFQEYQDKPFHELFMYDDENLSWLILRPSRLKDAGGKLQQVARTLENDRSWMYPPNFEIDDEEKISINVNKNLHETYSYYLTVPFTQLLGKEVMRGWAFSQSKGRPELSINPYFACNPSLPSYVRKYGFRKFEASTTFVDLDPGQFSTKNKGKEYVEGVAKPGFIERGKEMNKVLVSWFLHNPLHISGTIDIAGTNRAIIGTYVTDKRDNMEYYVEGVSHNFQLFTTYRTTLRVTRGQPLDGLKTIPIFPTDSSGRR